MADISVRQASLAHVVRGRNFLSVMRGVKGYLREFSASWSMDSLVESVSLDSRLAKARSVFVCLRGEKVDGHSFLSQVLAQGCRICLVSEYWARENQDALAALSRDNEALFIVFSDALVALQDWAGLYLRSLAGMVRIGVTGSNGKTTTKELIRQILSTEHEVFASPGNMNSVLGLPLAILSAPDRARVGVFEMAMSERGEMDALSGMILPDLGIITNIGRAHIGNIGSQQGIAEEKKRIFSRMDRSGIAFIPDADPWAGFLEDGLEARICRYGELANPGYEGWEPGTDGQIIHWNGRSLRVSLSGAHHRSDVLAAIRVAECLGISPDSIQAGLESFRAQSGRGQVMEGRRCTVVNDTYNANPDSMAASMRAFMEMKCVGRHVMILGGMAELGAEAGPAHRMIGQLAVELRVDRVVFVGEWMKVAHDAAREAKPDFPADWVTDKGAAQELLRSMICDGDLVLLKASRSMELEALLPVLGVNTSGGGGAVESRNPVAIHARMPVDRNGLALAVGKEARHV